MVASYRSVGSDCDGMLASLDSTYICFKKTDLRSPGAVSTLLLSTGGLWPPPIGFGGGSGRGEVFPMF